MQNVAAFRDDRRMPQFVAIEELFKGRYFNREIVYGYYGRNIKQKLKASYHYAELRRARDRPATAREKKARMSSTNNFRLFRRNGRREATHSTVECYTHAQPTCGGLVFLSENEQTRTAPGRSRHAQIEAAHPPSAKVAVVDAKKRGQSEAISYII